MAVKITKPALNIREELSSLKKPSGIAGEAMLRADTPQEQFNLIGAGRKNLIINGAMQVWQRGTSFSDISNGTYTADRFVSQKTGTTNISRVSCDVDGFDYALRTDAVAASSIKPMQLIEARPDLYVGNTFTFSFWARANRTIDTAVSGYNGADAEFWGNTSSQGSITTEWKRFTFTHTLGYSGTSSYYRIYLNHAGSAGDWLETTGWQFEAGSVATPFEHRSYGEELALCQRYFWKYFETSSYRSAVAANTEHAHDIFHIGMRTTPSISIEGSIIYNNCASITPQSQSKDSSKIRLYPTITQGTYRAYGHYYLFDAEL